MWILIRLVVAACGFFLRFSARFRKSPDLLTLNGVQHSAVTATDKQGRVTRFELGVPFDKEVALAITPESRWDAFFKASGLSDEFQTGDGDFDRAVYLACDHPFFCRAMGEVPEARAHVRALLGAGFQRIHSDGRMLYAKASQELSREQWVPVLNDLRVRLEGALDQAGSRFRDPFAFKALVVEAVIWSVAAYSAAAFLEWTINPEEYHVSTSALWSYGLGLAGATFLAGMFAIVTFLKGSSRGHRILIESALVLLLSLPVFGVQAVSDYNRGADTSEPIRIEARVDQRYTRVTRSRRSRRTHYYLRLTTISGPIALPGEVEVSSGVYGSTDNGRTIPVEIGRGSLGIPWYRSINGIRL